MRTSSGNTARSVGNSTPMGGGVVCAADGSTPPVISPKAVRAATGKPSLFLVISQPPLPRAPRAELRRGDRP